MRKLVYLISVAMITAGLSAQVSPAVSDLPRNQQMVAFLTESIDWYRHSAIERQVATDPTDVAFLEGNRPGAAQILQLSFDFARAGAQFSAIQRPDAPKVSSASPDLAQWVQLESNTEVQSRQASADIETITNQMKTAHGAQRRDLQAALETTQSRLDALQAGSVILRQLVEFMRAFTANQTGDLASAIDELARTVPDVTSSSAAASQSENARLVVPTRSMDSGILALSSEVSALGKKVSILDDEIRRTDHLEQVSAEFRNPLLTAINKRLPALSNSALEVADAATLQRQKAALDELAALVKMLSPAIVALDKQRILLASYTTRLKDWRAAVLAEDQKTWRTLISRSLGAAVLICALITIGALARRVTHRHMHDTDRRHIVLVVQRLVIWSIIVAVAAFAFASDLTSLATFLGLAAAGFAVALHSVIIATLGYFMLIGRRGIRIGDRVEISGITGDVADIGWLQFQLKEIDKETQLPTGKTVTFSNSFVFLSPATGLSRFRRNELKGAPSVYEPLDARFRDDHAITQRSD